MSMKAVTSKYSDYASVVMKRGLLKPQGGPNGLSMKPAVRLRT